MAKWAVPEVYLEDATRCDRNPKQMGSPASEESGYTLGLVLRDPIEAVN